MKQAAAGLAVSALLAASSIGAQQARPAEAPKGVALSELAWPDAEPWLAAPSAVVVLPLGAGALEQGRHIKLDGDERLARYLASRVKAASTVVIAPALTYHFYPAYGDYPGSTSLGETTARDVTVDAVRSLARSGARRFYVLNTSPSTLGPLSAAAKTLADAGILLGYTDPGYWTSTSSVLKQTRILASHADEAATSMLMFVDPAAVDIMKAVREYPSGKGALTRQEGGNGVVSRSGTLGDPTLATAEKGRVLVDALVTGILDDIEKVRAAALPAERKTTPAPAAPAPAPAPRPSGPPQERRMPNGCTAGEDRAIRNVGDQFTYYWAQQDPVGLVALFTANGDIRHPDGTIERGTQTIQANRAQLFSRREYQGSKHPVQLTDVRCLGPETAIADGKWELRLDAQPLQQTLPGIGPVQIRSNAGWCTLIVVKREIGWLIEAWRYTINPPAGAPPPVLLSKPGFTGRGGG